MDLARGELRHRPHGLHDLLRRARVVEVPARRPRRRQPQVRRAHDAARGQEQVHAHRHRRRQGRGQHRRLAAHLLMLKIKFILLFLHILVLLYDRDQRVGKRLSAQPSINGLTSIVRSLDSAPFNGADCPMTHVRQMTMNVLSSSHPPQSPSSSKFISPLHSVSSIILRRVKSISYIVRFL